MGLNRVLDPALVDFATSIGTEGPVCPVGGRTQWSLGGLPAPGTREVAAPSGVVAHEPAEMVVRVRAGTTVASLSAALRTSGQMVPIDPAIPEQATVGGVLAAGQSGPRRLRYGPLRDTVLEVHFVSAAGRLIKAGGPVVKNVSGYDLCRLLVGSLGTLGVLAEVVLRCQPLPATSSWYRVDDLDPFDLAARLYRPSSILWDGNQTWVLLEGDPDDVAGQARSVLGLSSPSVTSPCVASPSVTSPASGPPSLSGSRLSLTTAQMRQLRSWGPSSAGPAWWAEVGVGTVHTDEPERLAAALSVDWPPALAPAGAALNQAVKARFDPSGRLNPGRSVA
jgi:FAD/FMN-containing dehydrogenase